MEFYTLCQKCGAKIRTDDAFCSNCGAPQDAGYTEKIPVCTNCGAEVKPSSTFCPKCGNRLAGEYSGSHKQTAEQTSANESFKTGESEMKPQSTLSADDPLGSAAEHMKKVNSLCIAGVVVFLFGILLFKNMLVMVAAFFLSLIGYFDAQKKNQIGKTIGLICMVLSGIMSLIALKYTIDYAQTRADIYGTVDGFWDWLMNKLQ